MTTKKVIPTLGAIPVYQRTTLDLSQLLNEQLIIDYKDRAQPLQIKCLGIIGHEALRGVDTEGMNRIISFNRIQRITLL